VKVIPIQILCDILTQEWRKPAVKCSK